VRTFKTNIIKTIERAGPHNFLEAGVRKYAILTGGGAMLPMIRDLFAEPFEVSSEKVFLQLVDPTPNWVLELGSDVREIFPQLAVSTGGSSPDLVEERAAVTDMTQGPKRVWGPRWT
jgi:hypothetical protein